MRPKLGNAIKLASCTKKIKKFAKALDKSRKICGEAP